MTFEIKHATQVDPVEHPNDPSVPVGTDAWNAALAATMATARLLGRVTTGTGDVEELTAEQLVEFLELAMVALSGSYSDLDNLPTLGSAAAKDAGAAAGNVPLLDGDGKLATSVLPALALTDVFEVASQAAMLALTAQPGDIAIRTDINKTFALATGSPATLANWKELRTPTDVVLSVAGLTGTITASALKSALAVALADITDMSANGRSLVAMTYANMFAAIKQAATTSATGVVELATNIETQAGTDTARAVTPAGLASTIGQSIQGYSSILAAVAALSLSGNAGKAIVVNPAGNGFVLAEGGGGMKSVQTGFVSVDSTSSGANPDTSYVDVTISAVDTAKCMVELQGGFGVSQSNATGGAGSYAYGRLLNSTTLRLHNPSSYQFVRVRWFVVEFS